MLASATTKLFTPGLFVGLALSLLAQPGTKLWDLPTGDPVLSSPAIGPDGTIYVGSYDQTFYALNPATGAVRWTNSVAPTGRHEYVYIYSSPAVAPDGTIYFGTDHFLQGNAKAGELYALNPDGSVKWVKNFNDAIYSDPAIGPDGTIYVGCYDTNLYAFDPDGNLKWTYPTGDQIFSDPVTAPTGTIYFGCDDGKVYALNSDGTLQWEFITGDGAITASPALGSDGTIYVGVGSAFNPKLYAIHPNGATNWIFTAAHQINSSVALGPDGTLYFGSNDRKLYALNPDGREKWHFLAGGAVRSSPAVAADGTIYFGADDGLLYALDSRGSNLWTFATTNYVFASPAIAVDGTIYFASADYNVYAVRGSTNLAVTPWPMFRNNLRHTGRRESTAVNHPPVLAAIANQTILEGAALSLTNRATESDADDVLNFSLAPGAPDGVSVHGATGVLTWTPTEAQGPSTNTIAVRVTDSGSPPLSDAKMFTVFVLENNSPPLLEPMADRAIHLGTTVVVTNRVGDPDVPLNQLTFELAPGAPFGASVDSSTGVFTWTPHQITVPSTNLAGIRVTDNGAPPLSAQQMFTITVLPPPRIHSILRQNGRVELTWSAIAGTRYRLQYKSRLEEPEWTDLPGELVAAGAFLTWVDMLGPAPQRFYRILVLP